MRYRIELKKRAVKDLRSLEHGVQKRIIAGLEGLQHDLHGDVKRLTNFTPEYRLRVGDYRVLFEVAEDLITVYRFTHRRDAYS